MSKPFFLYHRKSRPTGQVLAEALGVEHGERVPYGFGVPLTDLIRWGSQAPYLPPSAALSSTRIVNKADALAKASDKYLSLQLLRDAGVRVPNFSEDPEELQYPFLGRRRQHARGTDVVLVLQKGDILRRSRDYYVQYIPTTREFRLHVVGGKVIRTQGKFLDRPELAVPWIRNYATGYRFRAPRRQLNGSRVEAAVNAVRALGLDFGAVDLLIGNDGLEYVLEVNTAPSCSPLTARQYVTEFQRLLNLPSEQVDYGTLSQLSDDQDDSDAETPIDDEITEEEEVVQDS